MRQAKITDYLLLILLALIWASAFFNIKIATYSYGPVTIAFLRVFFGAIPVLLLCYYKNIKIEAFSKDWHWFAMIGFINLVAPFYLIAYGVQSVQSNLAAILMSTTPLSSTVLGHFYTTNEKFNFIKTFGILIGFSGILYLFSDNLLIDENNFLSALLILLGSTCYVIGGVLTLKISKKKNENVTGSILIWATIILIPLVSFIEQPWNLTPRLDSTVSVIYLGLVSIETRPKYITDTVESNLGVRFQGCSIKLTSGIKIIVAQINIDPVTFSFFFLLIFKVRTPPIT